MCVCAAIAIHTHHCCIIRWDLFSKTQGQHLCACDTATTFFSYTWT